MLIIEELIEYSYDILDGKIEACQKHKWVCERFLNDLERANTDDFPYIWDEEKAVKIVEWFTYLRHTKGVLKGKSIELTTWQRFVQCNIFAWVHRDTGYRRFTKAYVQVGRKNTKSQMLSGDGLYELMADGESGSEVYCAATKTDQALIVWREAKIMALNSPEIKKRLKIGRKVLEHEKSYSFMCALSREDNEKGDGFNPQFASIDEYHLHPRDDVYGNIETGMGARTQPLMFIITTAGFDLNKPCYKEYQYCGKILNPDVDINNESYFVMICELDSVDEINDETKWIKPNPILATYPVGLTYLRKQQKEALDRPEKMRTFLTKNMNIWVDQKDNGYMDMSKWRKCEGEIPDLKGKEFYGGIDLSKKIDLTSISFEFPFEDDTYVVMSHSFIPEDTLHEKAHSDKVPYQLWVDQGWITVTPGAVTDYRFIAKYIEDQIKENGWVCKEICFDPFNATQFANEMMDKGFEMVEIRQGVKTLSEPTKNFRESVYQKKVIQDGNPVLNWAISNAVTRQDHNENIMLDKDKSTERIDPIASVINAHVRAMVKEKPKKSVYEERGIRTL